MKLAMTLLATSVASLLSLGIVVLYSASMGGQLVTKQLIAVGLGMAGCIAAILFDYRWLKRIAPVLYAFAAILLALVLIPSIGVKVGGARRWLSHWGFSFQPSDLAKVVMVICLALYVETNQRRMNTFVHGLAMPGLGLGLLLALIFREPDYGTTALMGAVSICMLLIGGARWMHVLPIGLSAVGAFAAAVYTNPVRAKRVFSWLDLEGTKNTTGYQVYQALIALGSGGLTGIGLGSGRQKLGWVPEHHTDFIFSVVGEEMGLAATLAVIVAFIVFVVCGVYIAWKARDTFGFMLAGGLTLLIGLQAFINIGVVTGALPNKGLSLPFMSFGGSNMMMMLTAVGVILSVALRAPAEEEAEVEQHSLEAEPLIQG